MKFDFAAAKALARRTVHDTFGLDAEYQDDSTAAPVPLRVRWHNKMTAVGDPNGEGFPVTIEGIDKVIFDLDELAEKNLQIVRGGELKITAKGFGGQILAIDTRDPRCGPTEEIWHVGKLQRGRQHP